LSTFTVSALYSDSRMFALTNDVLEQQRYGRRRYGLIAGSGLAKFAVFGLAGGWLKIHCVGRFRPSAPW
jgi:hypothetical protein